MSIKHENFYESVKEADMRLTGSIVLYDNKPYYVLCVTDHKKDGVFRIYLDDMTDERGLACRRVPVMPYTWMQESPTGPTKGDKMDEWLETNKNAGVLRKQMNSPLFYKFRPFPLGMCNVDGSVVYVQRQPTRNTQQGLIDSALHQTILNVSGHPERSRMVSTLSRHLTDTIVGNYPDAKTCLKELADPLNINKGAAFNRDFAFLKAPLDIMYLAYKQDIVGYLPNGDTSRVTLGSKFVHVKEAVSDLNLFDGVQY